MRYHFVFQGESSAVVVTRSSPSHLMLAMPTHPGTISRAGKPVVAGQRLAVHRPGDQDVVDRLGDRQRPPDPAVVDARRTTYGSSRPTAITWTALGGTPACRSTVASGTRSSGRRRSRPGPTGCPAWVCPAAPRIAAPVAGALERPLVGPARERLEVGERVRRVPDDPVTGHQQPPGAGRRSPAARVWLRTKNRSLGVRSGTSSVPDGLDVGAVVDEPVVERLVQAISQHDVNSTESLD